MKVSSGIQTLLPARERVPSDSRTATVGGAGVAAGDAVLRRITIVSAHPQSVFYLRAEFSSSASAAFADSIVATVPQSSPRTAHADAHPGALDGVPPGIPGAPRRHEGLSAYLRPTEQYARNQRLSDSPPRTTLDVHA